jgi:hypothetical protein
MRPRRMARGGGQSFGVASVRSVSLHACAYWSPSLQEVRFGGDCIDTPAMRSADEPSERVCWQWPEQSDTHFARRLAAARARENQHATRCKALGVHYAAKGYN